MRVQLRACRVRVVADSCLCVEIRVLEEVVLVAEKEHASCDE